jgi:hypothetical protein
MGRQTHFIGSATRISALQQHCFIAEEEVDQTGIYRQYICTADGSLWNYYSPPPDGFPKCEMVMVRNRVTLDDIKACILEARYTYEIAIACAYIEWRHYEPIVAHLEQIVETSESLHQLRNVARTVVWSDIGTPYNHSGSHQKTVSQIEGDYEFFKSLVARAIHVRNIAEARLGIRFHRRVSWK